ncbi:MAG: hypothetical protein A3H02_00385 [Candidatus Niyogibacteria bacterium RIFCSPLOWO2_12_FULL_41_13]|uniref:MgtC/SapB/SrpB/YhiD N-terminal domain-containing protein n=1 Tax=Candidatus Niyogibacteria bacterium RIFCSPLOWO2_12_FULL_41_13 TaxID=1801726 RepID=A0A1G2F300_9BACT|nr:MAG: hypothetical protein A3H02_00385 [Candidatus Niyogibacteria bacterium RIFCSPLOWO2_12_FULL_41_13]
MDETSLKFIFQLVLASVLGLLIGVERWRKGKPAGMRTFALVALGSALFTILSVEGFKNLGFANIDPSRVAANIVLGVGFLGAGIIFLKGGNVRGITTAAVVWICAAIGMAVGLKMYLIAVSATILALIILVVIRRLESELSPIRAGDNEDENV